VLQVLQVLQVSRNVKHMLFTAAKIPKKIIEHTTLPLGLACMTRTCRHEEACMG
jgi:hypothetical protein